MPTQTFGEEPLAVAPVRVEARADADGVVAIWQNPGFAGDYAFGSFLRDDTCGSLVFAGPNRAYYVVESPKLCAPTPGFEPLVLCE